MIVLFEVLSVHGSSLCLRERDLLNCQRAVRRDSAALYPESRYTHAPFP
jgi:hypothetical protein